METGIFLGDRSQFNAVDALYATYMSRIWGVKFAWVYTAERHEYVNSCISCIGEACGLLP